MSQVNPSQDQMNQPPSTDQNSYDLLKDTETTQEAPEDLLEGVVPSGSDSDSESETDEPEEETDDTSEEEPEVETEPEEDLEVHAPIKMSELLKKYPNIKKEFPDLIAANFREQKYAEIVPTIEDAKIAVERSETLAKFEKTIFGGETAPILSIVKQDDPGAFAKIVDNYLPALKQTDEGAFRHVVGGLVNHLANEMFAVGANSQNEDLKTAAQILYNYMFPGGKQQATTYGNQNPAANEELDKIKKERAEFEQQRYDSVSGEITQKTDNLIKATIDKHIDPKDAMPPYVRRNAINDCLTMVKDEMKADTRFNKIVEGMWAGARKNNYRPDDVAKIQRTILGKARSLLTDSIRKVRNEALKGISQRSAAPTKTKVKVRATTESAPKPKGKLSTFELLSQD